MAEQRMLRRFRYHFARYSDNANTTRILAAADRLEEKLRDLNIDELNLSDYNTRYLGSLIATSSDRKANLTKYAYLIVNVVNSCESDLCELVFLDHGGGHGLMSLLAVEAGFRSVVYNDIYEASCTDAALVGTALGLKADHYICGEIDEVIRYRKEHEFSINCVASYDVIEHVYDISTFFSRLRLLSDGCLSIFFASAANERNPFIGRKMRALHENFEKYDRPFRFGRKPTDTVKALVVLRKELIQQAHPDLSDDEVTTLAKLTRGQTLDRILSSVDFYKNTGVWPSGIIHPTNTCDPHTGNWFERLMDPDDLIFLLSEFGLYGNVVCGFYNRPKSIVRSFVKSGLNFLIRLLGKRGLILAPYYCLTASNFTK